MFEIYSTNHKYLTTVMATFFTKQNTFNGDYYIFYKKTRKGTVVVKDMFFQQPVIVVKYDKGGYYH